MRRFVAVALFLLASRAGADEPVTKEYPAILSVPAEIHDYRELKPVVTLIWHEPVSLFVSKVNSNGVTRLEGDLKVYDEDGAPVPSIAIAAVWASPHFFREMRNGDKHSAPLDSHALFSVGHPGRFYAVGTIGYASSGGKVVRFKTQKAWFTVR